MNKPTNEYVIAKYIRLSMDDAISESLSIPHQQMLLDRHIEEKLDMPNATVLEFVDNGYTGMNLERPKVQEMLELVRSGRINCIVVKDFSRFSRNAMESGYYIEQVFPLYQVRFIAIGDYFDTNDHKNSTGGIDVAFKFLMHEYYCKDLSKKIRSARKAVLASGENIVGTAAYGYRKTADGKWEPDPVNAEVVREIFRLNLDGLSVAQICTKLRTDKIPTPSESQALSHGKDVALKFSWTTGAVRTILNNEQYTGTYIAGKFKRNEIGARNKVIADREEWLVRPDSHPPIISKEDYASVQKLKRHSVRRRDINPKNYILRGKMKCGCCSYALSYNSNREPVFRCQHTRGDSSAECHKMKIKVREIDEAVLSIITKQAEIVLKTADSLKITKLKGAERGIVDCEKQINEFLEQRQKYYEQFVLGEIDTSVFNKLKTECSAQLDRLDSQLALLKQAERNKIRGAKVSEIAKTVLNETATHHEIVDALIEKVSVFPDNRIEIEWKFTDFIQK